MLNISFFFLVASMKKVPLFENELSAAAELSEVPHACKQDAVAPLPAPRRRHGDVCDDEARRLRRVRGRGPQRQVDAV